VTDRPSIDRYFLAMAEAASDRAECVRRKVGAIVVKQGRLVGHGFNGALPGAPSCLDGACPRAVSDSQPGSNYSNCIADHAERNALRNTRAEDRKGSVVYVNAEPCDGCITLLRSVEVERVVWPSSCGEPLAITLTGV
jgi:dCMP deaminase